MKTSAKLNIRKLPMPRYINPYTDFGFKKLFGEEANSDLLTSLLNALLPPERQIASLSFLKTEQLGLTERERHAVFDILCESETGEKFIVEMQKAKQQWFKDRALFYASRLIVQQAVKGDWNFKLSAVYLVGIIDFEYDENEERRKLFRDANLKDQDGDVFSDKLNIKLVQMPLFNKDENNLQDNNERWLYFLKHLPNLEYMPSIFAGIPVFEKAFHEAELAAMSAEDRGQYEDQLFAYWTDKAAFDTARNEGKAEGLAEGEVKGKAEGLAEGEAKGKAEGLAEGEAKGKAEGLAEGEAKGKAEERAEVARNMKKKGFDSAMISEMTGLPVLDIEKL